MYKKGAGEDKQGKDAGNRKPCPYKNFSQAIIVPNRPLKMIVRSDKEKHIYTHPMYRIFLSYCNQLKGKNKEPACT